MQPADYVLELAVPTRLWQRFDYLPPADSTVDCWQPGIRVQAPFGRRLLTGILMAVKPHSDLPPEKLKTALMPLDPQPLLTPAVLALCQWASDYYHYPLGEVLSQALPKTLRQGRQCPPIESAAEPNSLQDIAPPLPLNAHQQQAVQAITEAAGFKTFLLDGVTGSGKTEVYFQSITALLAAGKQVLVLVPEIGLTPQTVARFRQRFPVPIALLHSDLSDKKRLSSWLQAQRGTASIIIGARSAIFTPLSRPGMIILDEEHDLSFKQQTHLRYSARDLAIMRGQLENIPVVLGSATPSLESLYNAKRGKYTYLCLPQRAGDAKPPAVSLINLRDKRLTGGLSAPLLEKMREHLAADGQVLLFLNRRGYASVLMCHHCGWMARCTRCDARLTVHYQPQQLHCHHCGAVKRPPARCEQCRYPELITVGQGTERIEQVMADYFPEHRCVRIDRDSTKQRGSMEKLLMDVHAQKTPILIGTQMLAKGHHFPDLSLVAIIDADSGLFSVDFRALERMAQLLVQVAGRAGRAVRSGEVMIQTHHPDHPHLQLLLKSGYQRFAESLLAERCQAGLPPYAYLALLRADSKQREITQAFLNSAKTCLENVAKADKMSILGPVPAPMERCADRFRGHLLLQAAQRSELQSVLRTWTPALSQIKIASKVRWSLDIDPQELI
jgi:primosomal protein N' (replication factor Y) (superfamily II helicase)